MDDKSWFLICNKVSLLHIMNGTTNSKQRKRKGKRQDQFWSKLIDFCVLGWRAWGCCGLFSSWRTAVGGHKSTGSNMPRYLIARVGGRIRGGPQHLLPHHTLHIPHRDLIVPVHRWRKPWLLLGVHHDAMDTLLWNTTRTTMKWEPTVESSNRSNHTNIALTKILTPAFIGLVAKGMVVCISTVYAYVFIFVFWESVSGF